MGELDRRELDSSADTAENRAIAGAPAADRASAGPDLFVVHDEPGRPLEIVVWRDGAPIARRAYTPRQAVWLAELLLAGVQRRLP